MRFPSLRAFKRSMGGRPGYMLYMSKPKSDDVQEILIRAPLTDDQYERLYALAMQFAGERQGGDDGAPLTPMVSIGREPH